MSITWYYNPLRRKFSGPTITLPNYLETAVSTGTDDDIFSMRIARSQRGNWSEQSRLLGSVQIGETIINTNIKK